MIVALIPAHNEEAGIAQTIMSLQSQTIPPDRIVVVADNCTDHTEALALANDAEVFTTVGNTAKKAGALNQALDFIMPDLNDDDAVLILDADGFLSNDWISKATHYLNESRGAISGVCLVRAHLGLLPLLQGAEYAQDFRRVARKQGQTNVLSGAAAIFSFAALTALVESRGQVFDPNSLTEDFEITLALKMLGFHPRCFKDLVVTTDVMTTWTDLWRQRLRWQRGTIETLWSIGYNKTTRAMFWTVGWCYLATIILALTVVLWIAVLALGMGVNFLWLLILPVFMAEQWVTSQNAGRKAALVAATLVPSFVYGLFRACVYWTALFKAGFGSNKIWIT